MDDEENIENDEKGEHRGLLETIIFVIAWYAAVTQTFLSADNYIVKRDIMQPVLFTAQFTAVLTYIN